MFSVGRKGARVGLREAKGRVQEMPWEDNEFRGGLGEDLGDLRKDLGRPKGGLGDRDTVLSPVEPALAPLSLDSLGVF